MKLIWNKAPSTILFNLVPGDTFIYAEKAYIVTDNDNISPAPLPDYIYCVNLESGHLTVFNSSDVVFLTKIRGEMN